VDRVYNADDRRIHRNFGGKEGKAGLLTTQPIDNLARAGPGAIGADKAPSGIAKIGSERLNDQ
jgi:hypothetical protein